MHLKHLIGSIMRAAALSVPVCLFSCDEPPPVPHYAVLAGQVVACHTDTGELSIKTTRRGLDEPAEDTVYCLITRDAEIYVNDKFSTIDEIQLGDDVELIGRRDPDPQSDRFVINFAYFDHPLPDPPQPEFSPAPTPDTPINQKNTKP